MKQQHFTRSHGGSTRALIYLTFILLSFYNISDQILKGQNLIERLPYTLPFIILAVIVYIAGNDKFISSIYLFIAIFTTINTQNFSDYSGVIGFIIAFDLIKKKEYGLFIIVVSAISLGIRLIVSDETIPRTLAMILIFSFWFISYYTVIYQRISMPTKSRLSGLTKEENELLNKMCDGTPQGVAGSELGHKSKHETSKKMSIIRDKLFVDDSQSTDRVIHLFTKYGK